MSSESVCQVARSWVDVGSFHTRLFIFLWFVQRQSGIFWMYPRTRIYHSHKDINWKVRRYLDKFRKPFYKTVQGVRKRTDHYHILHSCICSLMAYRGPALQRVFKQPLTLV
jgi:hypothetical protein